MPARRAVITAAMGAAAGTLPAALAVAALAGLVSFFAPCMLPLVPGYLSYVTGLAGTDLAATTSAGTTAVPDRFSVAGALPPVTAPATATLTTVQPRQLAGQRPVRQQQVRRGRTVTGAALFVAGFTTVFALLAHAAGAAGRALLVHARTIEIDSPLAATNLAQILGLSAPPATATTGSYSPANIQVASGMPTTLTVRAFNIKGKQYILPENGDTIIDLGTLQPGELRFRCGMGMYTGKLTIIDPATQGTPAT